MNEVVDTAGTMDEMSVDLDLSQLSLDELAAEVRREYAATEAHLADALTHGVRCGSALLAAYGLVPKSEWKNWVRREAGVSDAWAGALMRIAYYRDHIPDDVKSLGAARVYTHGLPALKAPGPATTVDPAVVSEARRLRSEGLSYANISRLVGANQSEVWKWLNPAKRRSQALRASKKHQAARRALRLQEQQEERNRLAKSTGGELAKSYSLVRQALAALDKVATEQSGEAIRHLHRAEESIVEAMRKERAA